VEFYLEERLGHEFEFVGFRDPFFVADDHVPVGKQFTRGSSISIKQKFYNPMRVGMWYFGHEVRFTNVGHFANVPIAQSPENTFTATSTEQRIEYGLILGYRIMKNNKNKGFTIDTFCSVDFGYRGFDVEETYAQYFTDLNQKKFANTFHFGVNFGNVFSFR
ncbi:MAG: hypothetical protein L0Y35_01760, partial [Flammeovirgaceae bacterium]|nr:hypothetical protein [Flammeovirgaceae bacterium]